MREVRYLDKLISDLRPERADLLVRALQKLKDILASMPGGLGEIWP